VVVTFVLIPYRTKTGAEAEFMLKTRAVIMHNANVALMATELLVGELPIRAAHLPFVVLWGCTYVLFAWRWHAMTGVYYYPFLDHTLPWPTAVGFHASLIVALSLFHMVGVAASRSEILPLTSRAALLMSLVVAITKLR
jgi:hypothetical protein